MHERNPYHKNPPNFAQLAYRDPSFAKFLKYPESLKISGGRPTIDFNDDAALRALTTALLKQDFNLSIELPEDRLCPAVPGRIDYILWLEDIIRHTRIVAQSLEGFLPTAGSTSSHQGPIRGIDIGTGSSAIYPLLASRLLAPTCVQMLATELDPKSLEYAIRNVAINDLSGSIAVLSATATGDDSSAASIFTADLKQAMGHEVYDFILCNPPFYSSLAEIQQSASSKAQPPLAACTGAEVEMITPGGEETFVCRMVRDSATTGWRDRVHWFSSLLGKASSVSIVVDALRQSGVTNYATTVFQQGQTRRWAIGWSFGPFRLPDSIARPPSLVSASTSKLHGSLPLPNTLLYICPASVGTDVRRVGDAIMQALLALEIDARIGAAGEENPSFLLSANKATWSRAARRARARARGIDEGPSDAPLLFGRMRIGVAAEADGAVSTEQIEFEWL